MVARLRIALVSPFAWNVPSAVNLHVADIARELKARGHSPVVIASTDEPGEPRRMRVLLGRTKGRLLALLAEYQQGHDPDRLLLPPEGSGPIHPEDGIPVIPIGHSFPVRLNGAVGNLGLPVDVTSRLERLMLGAQFDIVHVHEPLAPSLSFTAMRESRSPVVATFHLTPLGVVSYELGQSFLERFFARLDARIVTFPQGAEMMRELYEGDYHVVSCGTSLSPVAEPAQPSEVGGTAAAGGDAAAPAPEIAGARSALYVYRGDGRRAYRAFLRALTAAFPDEIDQIIVAIHRASADRWLPRVVPRRLRSRVILTEFHEIWELAPLYSRSSVTVLPYLGGEWLCHAGAEAAVLRCPVLGPNLPPTRDLLESGCVPIGRIFSPSESGSLAVALGRLFPPSITAVADPPQSGLPTISNVVDHIEEIYGRTLAATTARVGIPVEAGHPVKPAAALQSMHVRPIGRDAPRRRGARARLAATRGDWINADLHVHSNYSKDCASTVDSILHVARDIGLAAIAIADHNEINGALRARELSDGNPYVIVAEEVKTSEGEVIGLFLEERIPKGLSFDDTLSLIKEQGGLVYVPHPFDALRTTPSYRSLVDNLHRIDVIETYNAKVALSAFNLSAERFAAKYGVVAGAGSDAHVLQGLGTAMLRMPRFSDPQGFMASLWEADIIARRKNLLFLQSLKLLQTTLDRVFPEE